MRWAELPLRLFDETERFILLRDQTRQLESAVRKVGDYVLLARLSTDAGPLGLGRLGELRLGQPSLGAASPAPMRASPPRCNPRRSRT